MRVIQGPASIQGSSAWLARRAKTRNASEAPVVMGVSPYVTRDQLLAQKATGITPEVTPAQQAVFDEGHRVEPLLRAMCEQVIGDELAPLVAESDDGYLSASFDGVTMMGDKLFEAKQRNAIKIEEIRKQRIPDVDYWQCVQQFAVCETAQVLYYYCGDGEPNATAYYTQQRTPQVEADIIKLRAAWAQFDKDLTIWEPAEPVAPAAIGHAPETLPALAVQITGAVTASNLPEFREHALKLIRNVKTELVSDQDFADAETTIKWAADIEKRITTVKQAALSQTASIDELFRTMDDISDEARRVRLQLSKSVKTEKDARKASIIAAARSALAEHVRALDRRLGFANVWPAPDYPLVIKGMSSLANIQSAVNDAVAQCKIETSAEADRVERNIKLLAQFADRSALFPDRNVIVLKSADDLQATITARIAQAKEAEAKRLEADRERIRAEEEAKVKAAAEAEAAAAVKAQAATAPAKPVIAIDGPFTVDTPASIPSNSTELERPTLTLGAINKRLFPISINTAGIASFHVVGLHHKNAVLYTELQFMRLLRGLVEHLGRVAAEAQSEQTEAEAA